MAYQEARAEGGAGLIVIQVSGVHETARYTSHILMATTDDCIAGYRRWPSAAWPWREGLRPALPSRAARSWRRSDGTSPSPMRPRRCRTSASTSCRVPLSQRLIREIVAGYGDAARRLKAAGLDGCEIVASHGYLPAQFLNPKRQPARGRLWRHAWKIACASCARWSPTSAQRPRPASSSACASPATRQRRRRPRRAARCWQFCRMLDGDGDDSTTTT